MTERVSYYLWLVKCMGVGNVRSHKILELYDDISEFYDDCKNHCVKKGVRLSEKEINFLCNTSLSDMDYIYEKYNRYHTQYITIEDELYPQQLRNIDNPPIVLFVVGDISHLEDELLITIVGTRRESLYGKFACRTLCAELCASGFSIVSGLANGGDTTAHNTALKCGARTYGFLACGLDVDYPKDKAALKNAIFKNGAIITEFLPEERGYADNFHVRNRLMSGISVGTLVIESPKRSGTLITAHHAANQGKDVFAVPGGIFWINGIGTFELIKNGAKPVRSGLDIIEEYIYLYPDKIKIRDDQENINRILDINKELKEQDENSRYSIDSKELSKIKKQADKEFKQIGKDAIKGKLIEQNNTAQIPLSERISGSNLNDNENVKKIISHIEKAPLTVDEIADLTDIPTMQIIISITKMELAGIVRKIQGNKIELIP